MEASTTALLYLNGVNVSFDGFRALNNLSLAVEPGEMRAIIGPNGAGKTTLFNCVSRLYEAQEGQIEFDGHDLLAAELIWRKEGADEWQRVAMQFDRNDRYYYGDGYVYRVDPKTMLVEQVVSALLR